MSAYPHARFLLSAAAPAHFPPDVGREVAVAGRSNAGKSSAINTLSGRHGLARTSKTPGRTRLLNFFELAEGARLVDLPGYGHAEGPASDRETWGRLIEALAQRQSLRGLLLIVDARRGMLPADEQLLGWADGLGHPVHVLLSKSDQLRRQEERALLQRTQAAGYAASMQLFSAHTGVGLDPARAKIDEWLGLRKKTPAMAVKHIAGETPTRRGS